MTYFLVRWSHESLEEPVELFSELDDHSWEVRKVEVFADGRLGFADLTESSGTTLLGAEPVPTIAEIALDLQFKPVEITKDVFERMWELARADSPVRR